MSIRACTSILAAAVLAGCGGPSVPPSSDTGLDDAVVLDEADAWVAPQSERLVRIAFGRLAGEPVLLASTACGVCPSRVRIIGSTVPMGPLVDPPLWEETSESGLGAGLALLEGADGMAAVRGAAGVHLFTASPTGSVDAASAAWATLPVAHPLSGTTLLPAPDLDGDGVVDVVAGGERTVVFDGARLPEAVVLSEYTGASRFGEFVAIGTFASTESARLVFSSGAHADHAGAVFSRVFSPETVDASELQPDVVGAEAGDGLGPGLSAGDLDGDGDDDLALPSHLAGLFGRVDLRLDDAIEPFGAVAASIVGREPFGSFGFATQIHDFDGDGRAELVVAAPSPAGDGPGRVYLFWEPLASDPWAEVDVWTTAEDADGFGSRLAVGDLDGDGVDALFIAAPGSESRSRIYRVRPSR